MFPTKAPVGYNALTDTFEGVERDDSRICSQQIFPETEIHTVFGDTFLLLHFWEKYSLISVLRAIFPKDEVYERVLCHILHGVLKDGSRISCDIFLRKSFAPYILMDVPVSSLHSDTKFFTLMGEDSLKVSYFRTFVSAMQKQDPSFGKGCY